MSLINTTNSSLLKSISSTYISPKCNFFVEKRCQPVERIINILKYYSLLDINNNEHDKQQLTKFCLESHKSLLDDYIHVITKHNNAKDLKTIFNILSDHENYIACNLVNCSSCFRHWSNEENNNEEQQSSKEFIFYRDIMDQIHCYVFHLYDVGLRIEINDEIKIDYDISDTDNKYFDSVFAHICDVIKQKKNMLKSLSKLDNCRFAKKKFKIDTNNNNHKLSTDNDKAQTFLDGVYQVIATTGSIHAQKMKEIIILEEYDSESLQYDITASQRHVKDIGIKNSNIQQYLQNMNIDMCYNMIKQYAYHNKFSHKTFAIGYRFYYWKY
eukprot:167414_1